MLTFEIKMEFKNILSLIKNEYGIFYYIHIWCATILYSQMILIKNNDFQNLDILCKFTLGVISLSFIMMNYNLYKKYKTNNL